MSIRPIPLSESSADQRLAYAQGFLNLELTGTENDDEITAKIQAAQPGVANIFAEIPDEAPEPAAAQPAPAPSAGLAAAPGSRAPEPRAPGAPRPQQQGRIPDPQNDHLGKGDPRAVIFINTVPSDDGSGERDVPLGVNGYGWLLKRGMDLNVPWRVVCALEQAEQTTITHRTEPERAGEVVAYTAKRFPYQMKVQPTQAEIDAWDEKYGAVELGGGANDPTPQPIAA